MLATFSNKLSQRETVLKEHDRTLIELQTLLQLDAVTGGSTSASSERTIHPQDSTQIRQSARLLVVKRLRAEIQQNADRADSQLEKLARKLERHDAEIAELRSKIFWTHAELLAFKHRQASTAVPQTPLPGTFPIDVIRYVCKDLIIDNSIINTFSLIP